MLSVLCRISRPAIRHRASAEPCRDCRRPRDARKSPGPPWARRTHALWYRGAPVAPVRCSRDPVDPHPSLPGARLSDWVAVRTTARAGGSNPMAPFVPVTKSSGNIKIGAAITSWRRNRRGFSPSPSLGGNVILPPCSSVPACRLVHARRTPASELRTDRRCSRRHSAAAADASRESPKSGRS